MSWSLPRLYLRPQRDSRSSELSVRRPLFCTAIFRRGLGADCMSPIDLQPLGYGAVAAIARRQIAGDAADGGDADPRLSVDLAIGQAALQEFDHRPTIRHRLQFRRRAQVAEKTPAFLDAAQRQYGATQGTFVLLFLAQSDGTVGFHDRTAVVDRSMY